MRTDLELVEALLKLVRKHLGLIRSDGYYHGLCALITMCISRLDEKIRLRELIEIIPHPTYKCTSYWWKPSYKYPRVQFLKKLIKKIKTETI